MEFIDLVFQRLKEVAEARLLPEHYEQAYKRLEGIMSSGSVSLLRNDEESAKVFLAERKILAEASSPYITNRVAVAYSKEVLKKAKPGDLDSIASALGVSFVKEGETYRVSVSDYLKDIPKGDSYKLFYVGLKNGRVSLDAKKFSRFLEEKLKNLFSIQPKGKDPSAKRYAAMLVEKIPRPKVVFTGERPPCIKDLLDRMAKHENLSHYARWSLGVFLIKTGMPLDDIVKLYSTLPDFDENITRYQLEHIKNKGYSMPSCDKMEIYGLRKPDCPCLKDKRIKSPIMVGMRKNKG